MRVRCAWCGRRTATCRVSNAKDMGLASSYCCDDDDCLDQAKAFVGPVTTEIVPMKVRST